MNAFIPIIPLTPPKETEGGKGAFSDAGTEGIAVLETVTAVATIMERSGPHLTMVPLEIFLIYPGANSSAIDIYQNLNRSFPRLVPWIISSDCRKPDPASYSSQSGLLLQREINQ